MAVVARNNLAPESQQWRKELETKVNEISLLSSNLSTLINGVNAKLSAINFANKRGEQQGSVFIQSDAPRLRNLSDIWLDTTASVPELKHPSLSGWETLGLSTNHLVVFPSPEDWFPVTVTLKNGSIWISNLDDPALNGATLGDTGLYLATTSTDPSYPESSIKIESPRNGWNFKAEITRFGAFFTDKSGTSTEAKSNGFYLYGSSSREFSVSDVNNGISASSNLIGTTTTTSNSAIWVSGGVGYQLRRNTSLREYKVAYEDVEGANFLAFKPRKWFDRGEVEDAGLDPETATAQDCLDAGLRWVPGFIAEEVEETDPLFASYNGGVLSGVAYDRLAVAVHNTLSNLDSRLKKLENVCSN